MLTVEMLNTYMKFDGNIDGWARSSKGNEKLPMTDDDWYVIDDLVLGLSLVAGGFASPAFSQEVESKLLASTADEASRDLLRALVARRRLNKPA